MNKFLLGASSLLLILTSDYASATVTDTILGSNFVNGQTVYTETFADGFTASFTGSRAFEKKTQDSVTGVGISGGSTNGEIDIGETLTGNFSSNVIVNSINVGLLFDGPEYSDVQEVAKLTVNFANGTQSSFTLTATGTHTAIWTGSGSVLSIGSGAVNGGTGEWAISNPFGTVAISSIQFTAAPGIAKQSCYSCNNQSDYTFVSMSVTPVPEPDTKAMILGGLLLLGGITIRRNKV